VPKDTRPDLFLSKIEKASLNESPLFLRFYFNFLITSTNLSPSNLIVGNSFDLSDSIYGDDILVYEKL
jgi:hypothetical protein